MGVFVTQNTPLPAPKQDLNPPQGLPTELDAADINNLWSALGDVRAHALGWVNVKDYGAKGDGVTDDTAAIRAAINAINTAGADTQVLYFPASANPYLTDPITLTDSDRQIIFAGDSLRASRIKIKSPGTYGIAFTALNNSWGGFRNIRIETDQALNSVIYINNPSNAVVAENVFVSGGTTSSYCITINGGSTVGFTGNWLYTTSATLFNFRLVGLPSASHIVFNQGNHDVAGSGILSDEATTGQLSGGTVLFLGGRLEGADGKNLFQFSTVNTSYIRIFGMQITSGTPAASLIQKKTGYARPSYWIDFNAGTNPAKVYADEATPANDITTNDTDYEAPQRDMGYLSFGSRRMWFDGSGRFREYNGAPPSDTSGYALTPRRVAPTYGTAVTIDSTLGDDFIVTPTDGAAFTISNPLNGYLGGQKITIRITNTFGVLGAVTWGTQYKLSAWTQPANGFTRSITFSWDGASKWLEDSRTTADVPN